MKRLLLLAAFPVLAAAQTGTVEGVAFNKLTKAPVAGLKLLLVSTADSAVRFEAVTDALGAYRIEDVAVGTYLRSLNIPGAFYPPDRTSTVPRPPRVEVKEGAPTKSDIELTPASILRGRVLDPDGKPVPRVRLTAVPLAGFGSGMGVADAEGRFAVRVPAGRFRLEVRPPSEDWAPEEYPVPIEVGEAVDLGGYDIRLKRAEGNRLRGVVRAADKPVGGVTVMLAERKVKSDREGIFEFRFVPAGEWRLAAKVDLDAVEWRGSTAVTMPNRDYDRAEIRLDPPFDFHVAVDGLPAERRPIRFSLIPPGNPSFPPEATERNGSAHFEALYPGRYRFGVEGRIPGRYLKAVLQAGADVTGRELELGPASPELKVVYAANGGKVRGEVENSAGVTVALIWADRDHYIPGADILLAACDVHGKFALEALRPGDWLAIGFRGQAKDLRDQIFGRGLWRQATSVRVAEGETSVAKISITSF
jgi:hypothetical protein